MAEERAARERERPRGTPHPKPKPEEKGHTSSPGYYYCGYNTKTPRVSDSSVGTNIISTKKISTDRLHDGLHTCSQTNTIPDNITHGWLVAPETRR